MKKRSAKIALLFAAVAVLILAVFLVVRTLGRDYVVAVNGSPVFEAEFQMLRKENAQSDESALRSEYQIPPEQSVADFLGEAEYRKQMAERNIQHLTKLRVEQELAAECGIIETFTYEKLLKTVETENQTRADKIASGEVVYGLKSFSVPQYYSYFMSNLETELLRALELRLPVTTEEVDAYYAGMNTYANVTGETITYTLYDIGKALTFSEETQKELFASIAGALTSGADGAIAGGGATFTAETRNFTPRELRDFVKQSTQGEFLLGLAIGEVTEPFSLGGVYYIARYDGFQRTQKLEDNDRDVLEHTLRQNKYDALIEQKTAQATIKRNSTRLAHCMEEAA